MKHAVRIKKCALVILGSAISAYGIDLAIHAGYGCATLAVLWQGIAGQTGITLGQASLLVAAVMVVFCLFYDRRQIHWGTLIYQVVYGVCMDLFAGAVVYTSSRLLNLLLMLLGILIFAVGIALYSFADYGRGAYEAVTFALTEKHGWQLQYVRLILDGSVVLLGTLLGGKPGICTLCTIFLSGYVIQFTLKLLRTWQKGSRQS